MKTVCVIFTLWKRLIDFQVIIATWVFIPLYFVQAQDSFTVRWRQLLSSTFISKQLDASKDFRENLIKHYVLNTWNIFKLCWTLHWMVWGQDLFRVLVLIILIIYLICYVYPEYSEVIKWFCSDFLHFVDIIKILAWVESTREQLLHGKSRQKYII